MDMMKIGGSCRIQGNAMANYVKFVATAVVAVGLVCGVKADLETTSDGITWQYSTYTSYEDGRLVKSARLGLSSDVIYDFPVVYKTTGKSVTIPSQLGGCMVRQLYGFNDYDWITELIIPEGISLVKGIRLAGCKRIEFPGSLKTFLFYSTDVDDPLWIFDDPRPFYGLTNVTEAVFAQVVLEMGHIWKYMPNLERAVIRDNVTEVNGLDNCSKLTDVVFPDNGSVKSIRGYVHTYDGDLPGAFNNCTSLSCITIPNSVTNMGFRAFQGCTSLTSVTLPFVGQCRGRYKSGTTQDSGMEQFGLTEDVRRIRSLTITDETDPGDWAFANMFAVTNITLSANMDNIGTRVFYGCKGLPSIVIPDCVTNIGEYAFCYCTNLSSVKIGASVKTIHSTAFNTCSNIVEVYIPQFISGQAMAIARVFPDAYSSLTNVVISEGATSIGDSAFWGCQRLSAVTIPSTVKSIGSEAFANCTNIVQVTIPDGVETIGDRAFANCTGMKRIFLPLSLYGKIGSSVFEGCGADLEVVYAKVAITATAEHGGNVSGGGSYDVGTLVTLTAMPDSGYAFSCWTGATNSTQNPLTVTADVAKSYTAVFAPLSIAFTSVVSDTNGVALAWNNLAWAGTYRIYRGTTSSLSSATVLVELPNNGNCTYLDKTGVVDREYWYWIKAEGPSDEVMSNPMTGRKEKPIIMSSITYTNLRGATNPNPTTYQEGTLVTFVNPGAVTGYTFAGWQPSQITADMTGEQEITALWTAHQYSIAYNSNGGSGTMNPTAATYDTNVTIPANKFTRTGHTFKGWATSATGPVVYAAGQTVKNLTTQSGGVVTLFASWEINKHTVVIDGVQMTVNYGTEYFVSAPASYTDHAGTTQYIPLGTSAYPDRGTSFRITVLGDVSFSWDIWRTNYWLEVEIDTPGTGTVTKNGDAVAGEWIEAGTEIDLLATPVTGYEFASWYGDKNGGVEDGRTLAVQMDAPRIIGARFLDGVADPVITPADGSTFSKASQTVSITCATDGSKIYYTTNGSNPKETETNLYKGEFTITDTTTIKAKTVLGTFKSGVVAATISKVNATAPAAPLIAPADGSSFWGDSCLVTITCETPNAIIYYSTTGANPKTTEAYRYSGPFEITETTIVKAIAKNADDDLKSSVTTATITKTVLTYEIALDASGLTFTSDGTDGEKWVVTSDPSADGGVAVKSGAIEDNGSTWIETTISGTGTFSFKWRADCEDDDTTETSATWDHLRVETNGVEVARIDGVTGWLAPVSIDIVDGATIRWTYEKDDSDLGGNDCVWIDTVIWTPTETIPLIADGSSAEVVNAAVDTANFADASVKAAIGGSASAYKAFKVWASGVAGGEAAVVASTNAAVSYMLGAERLFVNAPEIEFGECEVATATGEVTVSITVKDGEDAVAVASEKVKEMFEATSDLGDWNSAGKKLTPTVTDLTQGQANHLNFKVRPGDGTSPSAFLRIRK